MAAGLSLTGPAHRLINSSPELPLGGVYVLDEVRLDILETREVKAFNPVKWLREKIEDVQREFGENYDLTDISIVVSVGIPSGVSGSLRLALKPKQGV